MYTIRRNYGKEYESYWLIVKPNGDTLAVFNAVWECTVTCEFFGVEYKIEH